MRFLHYLIPASHYALLVLLFFVGLELMVAFQRWIFPFVSVLLVLMAIGVLLVRIEEQEHFRTTQVILPILAAAGLIGFSAFLPVNGWLHVYFVLASALLFWLLKHGSKVAYPTWNWTLATIVLFLDAATVLGLRFHLYDSIPLMVVLGFIFVVCFLVYYQAQRRVVYLKSEAALIAMAVALVLTELAWVLQFLPLHFVVQAGVLVCFYYIFFHLISISYERVVGRKDVVEYVVVGSCALLLILSTARWQ